jgi:hypothetical protein
MAQVKTPEQRQEVLQLEQRVIGLADGLGQTSAMLAEAMKKPVDAGKRRR